MKLLINTTGVSFNPFSAVSAEGYPITPLLVYACIPSVVTWLSRLRGEDLRAFSELPRITTTHLCGSGRP